MNRRRALTTVANLGNVSDPGPHGRKRLDLPAGGLRPVSQRAVDEFLSSSGCLAVDHEGFVRYAQVVVNLANRRAVEVLRIGFYQHRVLKIGMLDRKHFNAVMAQPGVVAAEHRFARRRLEHLRTWPRNRAGRRGSFGRPQPRSSTISARTCATGVGSDHAARRHAVSRPALA